MECYSCRIGEGDIKQRGSKEREALQRDETQASLLMLFDSDSPEWSENLIVLGRGIENWRRRYKARTHCIAGFGESSGLVRLYPLFHDDQIDTFDVIQVAIRDEHPEAHRPESRKVYPHAIRVVAREEGKDK